MGAVFESPFIVPVAAFAMVVGIILIVNISNYRVRQLRSHERLAAIEKGLALPVEDSLADTRDPRRYAARTRLTAIILIAVGVGTALAFALLAGILHERDVLSAAAFAVIPLAVGIGMLFDYRLQAREVDAVHIDNRVNRISA